MNGPLVIKLGGRALEAPGAVAAFAAEWATLGAPAVLVHGGGAEVSAWLERLGHTPRFHDGLRVTDAGTLPVAVAVLAGLANKRLVAALRARGVDAVGLAGLDGGVVRAEPHPEAARLGAVGIPVAGDVALLHTLLGQGRTPVLASLGADADGTLLNLNADDMACVLAAALGARTLLLLSDTPGVRIAGTVLAEVGADALPALLAHPEVTAGMRPKLRAVTTALAGGVGRVAIAGWTAPGDLTALVAGRGDATRFTATPLVPSESR